MDQTTQPTTNNPIISDFNVTTKVDPSSLPQNQVQNDLDALKQAEDLMTGSSKQAQEINLNTPKPTTPTNPNMPQELQALHLKNPFRGE